MGSPAISRCSRPSSSSTRRRTRWPRSGAIGSSRTSNSTRRSGAAGTCPTPSGVTRRRRWPDEVRRLAMGAFLMQVMVQGAWGVIPVHLNELSPDDARGTFPGFVYQLGNLIASVNATLQAGIAARYGGNYSIALAAVAGTVAVAILILTALGSEAKGGAFG